MDSSSAFPYPVSISQLSHSYNCTVSTVWRTAFDFVTVAPIVFGPSSTAWDYPYSPVPDQSVFLSSFAPSFWLHKLISCYQLTRAFHRNFLCPTLHAPWAMSHVDTCLSYAPAFLVQSLQSPLTASALHGFVSKPNPFYLKLTVVLAKTTSWAETSSN